MSPQISSVHPFFQVTTAGKFPFCWHRTELVRMLQKLLLRNPLHWPYCHSCVNQVQAAKPLCRKLFPEFCCPDTSFLSGICWVFLANSSCTPWSCHRQHKSPWWKKPAVPPLVAAAESHHPDSSLQGPINSLLWIRKKTFKESLHSLPSKYRLRHLLHPK